MLGSLAALPTAQRRGCRPVACCLALARPPGRCSRPWPAVKRLIGKEFEDVEQEVRQLAYTVTQDDDGFAVLECPALAAAGGAADVAAADDGEPGACHGN